MNHKINFNKIKNNSVDMGVNSLVISRVTENSISTIKFYRVFLKIYER